MKIQELIIDIWESLVCRIDSCRERVQRKRKRGLRSELLHLEVMQNRRKLRGLSQSGK